MINNIIQLNDNPDKDILVNIANLLKKGGIIIYPTETLYGLGCDALNEEAVKKVFKLKGRDFKKPLPVIIHNLSLLKEIVEEITPLGKSLIDRFWPGPLTLIFKASAKVPDILTAGTKKIGVRISSNKLATDIVSFLSSPISATSANFSDDKASNRIDEIPEKLKKEVDIVIDYGKLSQNLGSTIVDVSENKIKIIREGVIPKDILFKESQQF